MLPHVDKTTPNLGLRDTWEVAQIGISVALDVLELRMAIKTPDVGKSVYLMVFLSANYLWESSCRLRDNSNNAGGYSSYV